MKGFKEFIKKKLPVLSWVGHHELRNNTSIKEGSNPYSTQIYDKIHDHPDYAPQALTQSHKDAIKDYTSTPSKDPFGHGSSHNINGHLRYLEGHPDPKPDPYDAPEDKVTHGVKHHNPETVRKSIRKLSSAFTPENTNKKPITLHGGIPQHIGMTLAASGIGSQHHLAGFTSTSTDKSVANDFAETYANKDHHERSVHIIEYNAEPGTALSAVHHTEFAGENEMILHHGAKITYNGTSIRENGIGVRTHTHYVTVHNEHKPMEEYPKYKPSSYE
jgi:hypothetical protein